MNPTLVLELVLILDLDLNLEQHLRKKQDSKIKTNVHTKLK